MTEEEAEMLRQALKDGPLTPDELAAALGCPRWQAVCLATRALQEDRICSELLVRYRLRPEGEG